MSLFDKVRINYKDNLETIYWINYLELCEKRWIIVSKISRPEYKAGNMYFLYLFISKFPTFLISMIVTSPYIVFLKIIDEFS